MWITRVRQIDFPRNGNYSACANDYYLIDKTAPMASFILHLWLHLPILVFVIYKDRKQTDGAPEGKWLQSLIRICDIKKEFGALG